MPRLVCISDTHCKNEKIAVPDGDILIHAGDATFAGNASQIKTFSDWFCSLPHKQKIFVPGNHDFGFEGHLIPGSLVPGAHVLIDQEVYLEGLHFYGSPYTNKYGDWAFMKMDFQLKEVWDKIPQATDVLITHGPPFGVLDTTQNTGMSAGSLSLHKRVIELKPKLHVFGHIHEGYDQKEVDGIKFVNAAICNSAYKAVNAPIVIDLN